MNKILLTFIKLLKDCHFHMWQVWTLDPRECQFLAGHHEGHAKSLSLFCCAQMLSQKAKIKKIFSLQLPRILAMDKEDKHLKKHP
jgi:hypothetical protein